MAFFVPGSGTSLFLTLDSLFSQGSMRLWEFLIRYFDQYFWLVFLIYLWIHVFDFSTFWKFDSNLVLLIFGRFCTELGPRSVIIGFLAKNYTGYRNFQPIWCHGNPFREQFLSLAKFCPFLLRTGPRECHIRIPREKLYRIHKFSAKLVPRQPISWAIHVFL